MFLKMCFSIGTPFGPSSWISQLMILNIPLTTIEQGFGSFISSFGWDGPHFLNSLIN
jgi:hypothetical protein